MIVGELFEGAEGDVAAYAEANTMAHLFAKWMSAHNEDTPLGDIYEFKKLRLPTGITLMTIPAEIAGIDRDDLQIGFGWREDGKEPTQFGLLQRMLDPDTRQVVYYVACMLRNDPLNDVDVVYSMRWGTFIHELTHYLDFSRGFKGKAKFGKHSPDSSTPGSYLNDPTEFNAHFQQAMHEIMTKFSSKSERAQEEVNQSLVSFEAFKKWVLPNMPKSFHLYLNDIYKKKLERRLYKSSTRS